MKNLLLVMALTLSTIVMAGNNEPTSTTSQNDGIAKAMGAMKSECPNAEGNLSYSVEIQSICFVSGSTRKVSFWKVPNCPKDKACIQMIEPVGYVILDCENNVVEVSCAVNEM